MSWGRGGDDPLGIRPPISEAARELIGKPLHHKCAGVRAMSEAKVCAVCGKTRPDKCWAAATLVGELHCLRAGYERERDARKKAEADLAQARKELEKEREKCADTRDDFFAAEAEQTEQRKRAYKAECERDAAMTRLREVASTLPFFPAYDFADLRASIDAFLRAHDAPTIEKPSTPLPLDAGRTLLAEIRAIHAKYSALLKDDAPAAGDTPSDPAAAKPEPAGRSEHGSDVYLRVGSDEYNAALAAAERSGMERAATVCDAIAQWHANAAEEHRVAARELCGQRDEDKARSSVYCAERIRALAAEPAKAP